MVTIRQISFIAYAESAISIAKQHWQETEKHLFPDGPNINKALYEANESAGLLLALGAFDEFDRLVGYAVAVLCNHPHYSIPCAFHDSLFLLKEYRRGTAGLRLIKAMEDLSKSRGAKCISWNAKKESAFESLLSKSGAVCIESIYLKEL